MWELKQLISLRDECLACRKCKIGGQMVDGKFLSNVFSNMNHTAKYTVVGQNPGCFSIRTSIPTIDAGTIQANKLVNQGVGGLVESYNFNSDKIEPKGIINRFTGKGTNDWYRLEWDNYIGYFTGDHRFSRGRKWRKVSNFKKVEYVDYVDYDLGYVHDQILLGTILGDTGIYMNRRRREGGTYFPFLDFYQGQDQKEYLDWKLSFFKPLLLDNIRFDKRWSVYKQMTKTWKGFERYWKYCEDRSGNNILPWIKRMGPIAWAVWYMDDGGLDKGYVSIRVNKIGVKNAKRVCQRLNGMGFETYLTVGKKFGNYLDTRIRFRKMGSKRFLEMIAPFIHPCLTYKLGGIESPVICLPTELKRTLHTKAMKIVKRRGFDASKKQYAITVDDNHNHLLLGGIVSKNSIETEQKEPFVGVSGKMFDQLVDEVLGMKRSDFYITNCLHCYTPGNRKPTVEEVDNCQTFLDREVRILQPKLIISLGGPAFEQLTGMHGIMKHHGNPVFSPRYGRYVFPLLHPSPLNLNDPAKLEIFVADLLKLKEFIKKGEAERENQNEEDCKRDSKATS